MNDARELTLALGGRWHGRYGTAPCPVCQPERRRDQDGLTLADGGAGLLMNCKKSGCGFTDVLTAAGLRAGDYAPPDAAATAQRERERRADAQRKAAQAQRCWNETLPIGGTIAERYLRDARGITCPLPGTLRFHASCWHGPTARRYPAMVALVEGAGLPAVHRTWLRPDGLGRAALDPAKMMLGATAGGAVRLCDGPGRLVVGEGVETSLSLACGILSGPATIWAALSASGMRGLRLPHPPGRLTIASDGDRPGREAANALATRAHGLGWAISTLDPGTGRDFNDILRGKAVAT